MPEGQGFIKGADVYRSDDGGKTWRQTSRKDESTIDYLNGHSGTYGWVFGQIRVDPTDENTIYTLGLGLNVSRDGGKTFVDGVDAACTAITTASGSIRRTRRSSTTTTTAASTSPTDGGKTWTFAVSAGGAQFYNVDARHELAGLGVRVDSGSRQPPRRASTSARAAARSRPVALDERARRRGLESRHRSDQPEHRVFARLLRQLQPDGSRRDAASGGRRPRRRRGRGGTSTPIQPKDPDSRAARAVDGAVHHLAARRQHRLRRLSVRVPIGESRRQPGRRSARISPTTTRRRWARTRRRFRTRRSSRSPSRRRRRTCSTSGPTTAGCTSTIDGGKEWTELTTQAAGAPVDLARGAVAHAEGTVYVTQRGREDDDFARLHLQVHGLRQDVHEHRRTTSRRAR